MTLKAQQHFDFITENESDVASSDVTSENLNAEHAVINLSLTPTKNESSSVMTKPLRICILGYRSAPFAGGQGIYIKYLSKALVDAGHKVDVISGEPYPHLDERVCLIKMPGLNLYENGLGSIRFHHLSSYANIVEWMSKLTGGFAEPYCFGIRVNTYLSEHSNDYDIIHDNQTLSYSMLDIQKRIPLVTTLHHPITSDLTIALNACKVWWHKILLRRWYSFLTMQSKVVKGLNNIITVSESSQNDIAKSFGIAKNSMNLIYNGINTDEFSPKANIQRNPMRLMATASADQPLKGLRFLLMAYARLLPEYPQLELLVVGKVTAGGATDSLLNKLAISDKVKFVSGITTEKLVSYYAEASIAIVPSIYEGFGLPAGEAMACEVPVVSTTGGALPEVVGDAGILVPIENADAIANAIKELLENPEERIALGKAGRSRIVEKFSWTVAANALTQYYYQVMENHGNR